MRSGVIKIFLVVGFIIIFLNSCSSEMGYYERIIKDDKYDTEFPFYNASGELEKISNSIRIINCLAFYRRYKFTESANITLTKLKNIDWEEKAVYTETFNKSSSGTATIIAKSYNKVTMLTSAHIVEFTDTLYSFYSDGSGAPTENLESVSVKIRQSFYSNFPGGSELEIIVSDADNDVALIGADISGFSPSDIKYYNYKLGNSYELTWGTFVYIFSFPFHNKMITKGIVSRPESDDSKFFLIDAVLNRGSSGGIVLAVRDGVPNFELVGIISWMPAEHTNVLTPMQLVNDQKYQINSKYSGDSFIGDIENVKYGITKAVTIEKVKETIRKNAHAISIKGYAIPFGLE